MQIKALPSRHRRLCRALPTAARAGPARRNGFLLYQPGKNHDPRAELRRHRLLVDDEATHQGQVQRLARSAGRAGVTGEHQGASASAARQRVAALILGTIDHTGTGIVQIIDYG